MLLTRNSGCKGSNNLPFDNLLFTIFCKKGEILETKRRELCFLGGENGANGANGPYGANGKMKEWSALSKITQKEGLFNA